MPADWKKMIGNKDANLPIEPFRGGDSKPDLIKNGKPWLAKKDESKEELKERATKSDSMEEPVS